MQTLYLSCLKKTRLKRSIKSMRGFSWSYNKVENLASESETDDDYYEAFTDDNSKQDAEEEKENIRSYIYKKKMATSCKLTLI